MREIRDKGLSRIKDAEERVGMPLPDYFHDATTRGLDQREMGVELNVCAATVCRWLKKFGYTAFIVYRRSAG